MMELVFDCLDIAPDRYAAQPTLVARLRVSELTGLRVHSIVLAVQIRIEPQRRNYTDEQRSILYDVFGEPRQWGETLRPFQFAQVSASVPGFTGAIEVDVPVVCTYDLEVTAGRVFDALDDGEVPLLFLFSGTVFYAAGAGFQAARIPWNKEATYGLPAGHWRRLMDLYFPGQGWLRLDTETIDGLRRYKSERALPTWDNAINALLKEACE